MRITLVQPYLRTVEDSRTTGTIADIACGSDTVSGLLGLFLPSMWHTQGGPEQHGVWRAACTAPRLLSTSIQEGMIGERQAFAAFAFSQPDVNTLSFMALLAGI